MRLSGKKWLALSAILCVAVLDVAIYNGRSFWFPGKRGDRDFHVQSFVLRPWRGIKDAQQKTLTGTSAPETSSRNEESRERQGLGKSTEGQLLHGLQHYSEPGKVASEAASKSRLSRNLLQQPASNTSGLRCPLDFKGMVNFPWYANMCLNPRIMDTNGNSSCCVALVSALGQSESLYLRNEGNFRVKDVATVSACLKDLADELEAMDSRLDTGYILPTCFPESTLSHYVSSPSNCQGIETSADYVRVLGNETIQLTLDDACSGSLVKTQDCKDCILQVTNAIGRLTDISSNNSDCFFYSLSYAAGVTNNEGPYSQATASCLLAVQATFLDGKDSKDLSLHIAIGAAAALLAFLISFVLFFLWYRHKKAAVHRAFIERHARLLKPALSRPNTGIIQFSYVELKDATESFSSKNYLGSGACGDVYQGVLDDGLEVAIKRMKNCSEEGDADFVNEVTLINSVRHRHLVILRGYCITSSDSDGHQRLLIYDFMSNGSLYDYLFLPGKPLLSWPDRRRIIVEIAKGIAYLHNDTRSPIIHRDIKSSNVLLDEHLNAKVADFGLAKFSDEGNSGTKAGGTIGYVAPEYVIYGQLTELSDVYSFGVVVLEVMSGRKALEGILEGSNTSLITDWAWVKVKDGNMMDIVDERIRGTGIPEIMERFILVGILCAHMLVALRPTMEEVIKYLEGDVSVPHIPNRLLPVNHDSFKDAASVASPVHPSHVSSSPVRAYVSSSPVRAHVSSSPVRAHVSSSPVRAHVSSSPVRAHVSSPVRSHTSSPARCHVLSRVQYSVPSSSPSPTYSHIHSPVEGSAVSTADTNNVSSSWEDESEVSRREREQLLAMREFSGRSAEVTSSELLR